MPITSLQFGTAPIWPLVLLFSSLALALQLSLMRNRREFVKQTSGGGREYRTDQTNTSP